jgi:hypothetical protein
MYFRRDDPRYMGLFDTRQAEIANFQVAVLIYQDVARFQVAVYDTRWMYVFESSLNLYSAFNTGSHGDGPSRSFEGEEARWSIHSVFPLPDNGKNLYSIMPC